MLTRTQQQTLETLCQKHKKNKYNAQCVYWCTMYELELGERRLGYQDMNRIAYKRVLDYIKEEHK